MKPSKNRLLTIAIAFAGLLGSGQALFAQGWCVQPVPPCDPSNPSSSCYKPPPPDPRCEPRECKKCTKSPCFVGSGAYTTDATDLHLPTPGFPLVAARRYESTQVIDSPTGYGWTSSFAARLYYATYLLAAPDVVKREANVTMPTGDRYRFVENADGTFTPPLGRYDTLRRNADGSFDLTLQRSLSVLHFHSDGSLRRMADEYGNELVYSYHGSGRLERVADSAGSGRYIDVHWGADGRISSLVDSAARQVGYRYDGRGVLIEVSDPLGRLTSYTYGSGKYVPVLAAVRDNWNRVVSEITYDAQDRVTSYSENGETYTYTFNYQGDPAKTAKRDEAGNTWIFTHGAGGVVTSEIAPDGGTQVSSYYPDGAIRQITDEVGIKTLITYDSQGRIVSETKDYQGTKAVRYEYLYHASFPSRVVAITPYNPATGQREPRWRAWKYSYYEAGSVAPGALHHVYRVRSDGSTLDLLTSYQYNERGQVITEINPAGGRTDHEYNGAGDLIAVFLPFNNDNGLRSTWRFSHDNLGRVTGSADPLGRQTSYGYDLADRIVMEKLPALAEQPLIEFVTTYAYDEYDAALGLIFEEVRDPSGSAGRIGRDQFGREIVSRRSSGGETRYSFSGADLVAIIDANGNRTSYSYDALHRVTSMTDPSGQSEIYTYWPDNELKSKTDRMGRVTQYSYDPFKRLTSATFVGTGSVTWSYSGEMLERVSDTTTLPPEVHMFEYDSALRVISDKQASRGTINYSYAPGDQIAGYSVAGGPSVSYAYYPDQSVKSISWSATAGEFLYLYDTAGRYSVVESPNGQRRVYSYDEHGRLRVIENTHPNQGVLARYSYGYDLDDVTGTPAAPGRQTSMRATVPDLGLENALTRYDYDAQHQLTHVDYPAVVAQLGFSNQWTYDGIGNRVTAGKPGGSAEAYTYLQNAGSTGNGSRLSSAGAASFLYDANGNMTRRSSSAGTLDFLWDRRDRLAEVTSGGAVVAAYRYDFEGRRSRVDGVEQASYLFEGMNAVVEYGVTATHFLFGPGVDEVLAMSRNGATYFYVVDGIGSVTGVWTEDGVSVAKYIYGAWGETVEITNEVSNRIGFTGRERESVAGLNFFRTRYTDPFVGRFISEDRDHSADPLRNLYRYVENRPTTLVDPLGMRAQNPHDVRPPDPPRTLYDAFLVCMRTAEQGHVAHRKACRVLFESCLDACPCPGSSPSPYVPATTGCIESCRFTYIGCTILADIAYSFNKSTCRRLLLKR